VQQQRGGPVVTASGLILAATNDKKFRAYDADTGKVVWESDLPASAEGVPAVYEIAGREYIALCVAAGNGPGAYMVFALPRR
jgi:quinoprotein glucose dehydrogenase